MNRASTQTVGILSVPGEEATPVAQAIASSSEQVEQTQTQPTNFDSIPLMFSANPCPMWIYEMATLRFLEVNDAAVQQYGYSRSEFLTMTLKDIRAPEQVPRLLENIAGWDQGLSNGGKQSKRGIWRHRRKDGSELLAEITAFAYESGGVKQVAVLAVDVSKRVQAEQELRRSQASLQSLIDNAPFGICRGRIEDDSFETANHAFGEILGGYSQSELLSMTLSEQLYAEPRDRTRLLEVLRRNRSVRGYESTLCRRDGSKVRVRITAALVNDPGDNSECYEAYIEDLTQQSSLEQQVRQVQKLEAVGRLAGGVAHDFNNILVVIKLSTEMMLHQIAADSPLSQPLLQVSKAADRATSLTRQMLAFGRQQMMQVRTLNMNTVVSDISHMLRRIIGEDVELAISLSPELANTRLDSDQLGQVLLNLAVNARDAMPKGGTLHIETANVYLDNSYTREHPPVQAGNYVMLAVSDTGCGIAKTELPHIFDPFFTTKEVGKGTGLGLSIVYGIVKQSGGYIWVYSEPGHGTTFKLYFPMVSAAPEEALKSSAPSFHSAGQTLVLVDDDFSVRNNIRECLRHMEYTVHEADDGEAALALCDDLRGKVDLVITDLVMPGMSGHELAGRLAERHPGVRVLFMSGYTEDNATRRDILSRGSSFLQKPFSVAELTAAVKQALESSAMLAHV